jgi:hypothetical protein
LSAHNKLEPRSQQIFLTSIWGQSIPRERAAVDKRAVGGALAWDCTRSLFFVYFVYFVFQALRSSVGPARLQALVHAGMRQSGFALLQRGAITIPDSTMKHRLTRIPVLLTLAIGGCAQPGPPVPETPPVAVDTVAAVRAIRAAGDGIDSAVQVQPLRDAALEGFLKQAHEAETAHDYASAIGAADRALKLAPEAPDLLQYRAELDTARGQWSDAEQLALRSFSLGPKLGSLCARNWQTVVEARTALNDAATVAQAQQRLKECRVAPRLRM